MQKYITGVPSNLVSLQISTKFMSRNSQFLNMHLLILYLHVYIQSDYVCSCSKLLGIRINLPLALVHVCSLL